LDISVRCGDIRGQSRKVSKIVPNLACFWPPIIGEKGQTPKFLNWESGIIKLNEQATDHVSKFHGDRPTKLGNPAWRKKRL